VYSSDARYTLRLPSALSLNYAAPRSQRGTLVAERFPALSSMTPTPRTPLTGRLRASLPILRATRSEQRLFTHRCATTNAVRLRRLLILSGWHTTRVLRRLRTAALFTNCQRPTRVLYRQNTAATYPPFSARRRPAVLLCAGTSGCTLLRRRRAGRACPAARAAPFRTATPYDVPGRLHPRQAAAFIHLSGEGSPTARLSISMGAGTGRGEKGSAPGWTWTPAGPPPACLGTTCPSPSAPLYCLLTCCVAAGLQFGTAPVYPTIHANASAWVGHTPSLTPFGPKIL